MTIEQQGWGYPFHAKKAHYFKSGETTSLCGGMVFTGDRFDDNHNSPDNCAVCKRRFKKEIRTPAISPAVASPKERPRCPECNNLMRHRSTRKYQGREWKCPVCGAEKGVE